MVGDIREIEGMWIGVDVDEDVWGSNSFDADGYRKRR
jgi:hypothetical protein